MVRFHTRHIRAKPPLSLQASSLDRCSQKPPDSRLRSGRRRLRLHLQRETFANQHDKIYAVQRTDLMDTSEWAHQEMLRLLRQLTPSQRMQMVLRLSDAGREIQAAAMKRLEQDRNSAK